MAQAENFKEETEHNNFCCFSPESNTDDRVLPWRIHPAQCENKTSNKNLSAIATHSSSEQEVKYAYASENENILAEDSQQSFYADPEEYNVLNIRNTIAIKQCAIEPYKYEADSGKYDTLPPCGIYFGRMSRNALGLWVCNICNKTCKELFRIIKHIKRHYYECDNQCPECPLSFENLDELNFHKISHVTSSLVLGHVCKYCYKSFRQKHLLEKHVAVEHSDSNRSKTSLKQFRETCGKCVRVFYSSVEMENHDESCDERTLEAEEESSEEDGHESLLPQEKKDRRVSCYLCNLLFDSVRLLTVHFKKIHGGDRPLKCKEFGCGKLFKTNQSLWSHVRMIHLKFQKYECDLCKKKCRDKTVLDTHIRTYHKGEKPFKCNECGKDFGRRDSLLKHIKRHSAKYKCDVCDKFFRDKESLKRHKFSHSSEAEFVCEHCGLGIKAYYTWAHHLKHKSCSECDLEFLCVFFLQDHRKKVHDLSKTK